ncbi:helix-turn-helix domain-containing protein [Nocardioides donggukensis]|uniref:DNA-binding response regulator n=1 Tax=Nocardioides donggukensis TaxID=2774019 RepID=A0A927K5S4_9ACTN|nr:DNA-binding response regulator [Nocardioides donggukensis]MBD8868240.1 DNA-binding response regulator [Nocardioides donggukensis]
MPRRVPTSVASALGIPPDLERLYGQLLALSGGEVSTVASSLLRTPDQLMSEVETFVRHGVVRLEGDRIIVRDPTEAIAELLREQAHATSQVKTMLEGLARAVPFLTAAGVGPGPGEVTERGPLDGELSSGGDPLSLLTALISQSKGDLLGLRPDVWRMPRESAMARVIAAAVATGRSSRAIYPVVALTEAPDMLRARAEAGEQIRILPTLPTRLLVIGDTHAIVPEPLGFVDEPRILVRQRSIVEGFTLLFEELWNRASPVPELDRGEARPDLRRFLLQQLAEGANDEQISRTLGISLRTVRRRVADVLIELGADTRFQAGVEAVRRGWI